MKIHLKCKAWPWVICFVLVCHFLTTCLSPVLIYKLYSGQRFDLPIIYFLYLTAHKHKVTYLGTKAVLLAHYRKQDFHTQAYR